MFHDTTSGNFITGGTFATNVLLKNFSMVDYILSQRWLPWASCSVFKIWRDQEITLEICRGKLVMILIYTGSSKHLKFFQIHKCKLLVWR